MYILCAKINKDDSFKRVSDALELLAKLKHRIDGKKKTKKFMKSCVYFRIGLHHQSRIAVGTEWTGEQCLYEEYLQLKKSLKGGGKGWVRVFR